MKRLTLQSGFTFIELLVVVAIIGLLVAVVSAPLSQFRKAQAIENTANALVAVLNDARTRTLAASNGTNYSVRIESSRAILFPGSSYSDGAGTNEIWDYEATVTAAPVLAGGETQVTFDRLRGTTSQAGTVTLSSSGDTRIVTINSTGSIMRN
jgi:prepilin-type N-terminal cleavage/methylation domain-containing protein